MSRCCSRPFSSAFVYGALDLGNRAAQPPDSFDNTQYASANLVWMPTERWLFGIEGLWGKRVDKGGRMEPTFAPSSRPGSLSKTGRQLSVSRREKKGSPASALGILMHPCCRREHLSQRRHYRSWSTLQSGYLSPIFFSIRGALAS
ncbi:MAG: hypothetical protein KAV87_14370 [Desulfobacteraceae bacterium]|nr:hypothetical protein [Desulfobacteraceae bacterium]